MKQIDTSIKIRNYKAFGQKEQGFDVVRPLNLVIGRNNVGKSALLDAVGFMCGFGLEKISIVNKHLGKGDVELVIAPKLSHEAVEGIFAGYNDPYFAPELRGTFLRQLAGTSVSFSCLPGDLEKRVLESMEWEFARQNKFSDAIVRGVPAPFKNFSCLRISAERDIQPEHQNGVVQLQSNGGNATNIIHNFINRAGLERGLVKKEMLDALNNIFSVDGVKFSNIMARLLENDSWEIFLEDEKRDLIPLSNSGSGLKTIILVLISLILSPSIAKKGASQFVYLFEELENNLHPALQRSLTMFLLDFAKKTGCYIFMTTHSSVAIDLLSHEPEAQIVHVIHNGSEAHVKPLAEYKNPNIVLDDLDIRASDLLQANCIVWVEGPSDRLYFNRWIELWTQDDPLREGLHYQCVFYGGRLLAHLNAAKGSADELGGVRILNVNRKAVILIDSDKKEDGAPLNDTKERIKKEIIEADEGIAWVTAGREIENYIPHATLKILVPGSVQVGAYDDFGEKLGTQDSKWKNFDKRKVHFAESILSHFKKDDLASHSDLATKLEEVVKYIRNCNGRTGA